jgi:hypothetical protein
LLDVARTLATTTTESFFDGFDGSSMSAANWTAGGWTLGFTRTGATGVLGGVADGGLPVVGGGVASAPTVGLRTAKLVTQSMSVTSYREVALSWRGGAGSNVYVMLDMADSSPNPLTGGYVLVAHKDNDTNPRTATTSLVLFKDGVSVKLKVFPSGVPSGSGGGLNYILRLSVDGANVVRCYWSNASVPDFTYQPSSYTAAGGQVGFALERTLDAFICQASWFKVSHSSSAGAQPPHVLVMSKNGLFYYESGNGNMIQLNTALTLASDHWISSAAYLQDVYIADYALRTKSTSGAATTSAGASGVLTDTTADFSTDGVDVDDDLLDITGGTWGAGTGTGTYLITAVTAMTITISGTINAGAGTGVSYRVIRAPKKFASGNLTLTRLTASAGFVPPGCNIVAVCFDRVIWAGDDDLPEAVYLSKVGDPTNYNYGVDTTDQAHVFDPARASGGPYVGDDVTALIPHLSDYLVIGCKHSIYIQRGDPGYGNVPEVVTREVGIIGQSAWCYTPEGYIVALTQDGLYHFAPTPNTQPQKLSRDRIPEELNNINTDLVHVSLEYGIINEGINIFVTPKEPGPTSHWFFDWRTKSFHRESFPSEMEPTATTTHALGGQGSQLVVLGGRDGYLRVFADDRPDDDGENFESFVLIGPIALGATGYHDGILREVIGQLAADSGDVTLQIQVGDSVESAFNAVPRDAFTLRAGKNLTHSPRLRGNACFLRLSSTGGTAWAMEQLSIVRESLGKQRLL